MRTLRLFHFVILTCAFWSVAPAGSSGGEADKRLDIYWVDVEGGAATLMVTPTGESVLVDTGNPGRRDAQRIFDVAAKAWGCGRSIIWSRRTTTATTSAARPRWTSLMPIKHVYDNGEFEAAANGRTRHTWSSRPTKRHVINPGEQIKLAGGGRRRASVELKCLAARQQFIDPPAGAKSTAARLAVQAQGSGHHRQCQQHRVAACVRLVRVVRRRRSDLEHGGQADLPGRTWWARSTCTR